MSDWQRDIGHPRDTFARAPGSIAPFGTAEPAEPAGRTGPAEPAAEEPTGASYLTPAGADWLASASAFPDAVRDLWRMRPRAPSALPCGTAFDVVNASPLFGRRLLDRLWSAGPGSGPVAVHRGRVLLFAVPGTAGRLGTLLGWREWRSPEFSGAGTDAAAPPFPLICHGQGDTMTVPSLHPGSTGTAGAAGTTGAAPVSRWLVAPDVRHPWLPGPEVLLWACVRAQRAFGAGRSGRAREESIFTAPDSGARVEDVSRRR